MVFCEVLSSELSASIKPFLLGWGDISTKHTIHQTPCKHSERILDATTRRIDYLPQIALIIFPQIALIIFPQIALNAEHPTHWYLWITSELSQPNKTPGTTVSLA